MANKNLNAAKDIHKNLNSTNQTAPIIRTSELGILIVEDDQFSQKFFSHLIKKVFDSHQIFFAVDYNQARRVLANEGNIKFAIIDVFLESTLSGIDLLKFLKKSELDIPVIMTSNLDRKTLYKLVGDTWGNLTYLKKPFQPDTCRYILEDLKKLER